MEAIRLHLLLLVFTRLIYPAKNLIQLMKMIFTFIVCIIYSVELSFKCLIEGQSLGAVVCVGWWITAAGVHLAVGRHDGSIQLYLIDLENLYDKPRLKFTYVSALVR